MQSGEEPEPKLTLLKGNMKAAVAAADSAVSPVKAEQMARAHQIVNEERLMAVREFQMPVLKSEPLEDPLEKRTRVAEPPLPAEASALLAPSEVKPSAAAPPLPATASAMMAPSGLTPSAAPPLPAEASAIMAPSAKASSSVRETAMNLLEQIKKKNVGKGLKAEKVRTRLMRKTNFEENNGKAKYGWEDTRGQVMCRTGLGGQGSTYRIMYNAAGGEDKAIELAKAWVREENDRQAAAQAAVWTLV